MLNQSPRVEALGRLAGALNRAFGAPALPAPVQRKPVNRTGLPEPLKAGLESLSGVALDDVRVHRNSAAPAPLQAQAYAKGSDIHLAPGKEALLPHEGWHVVQQKQGRVRPSAAAGAVPINDDPGLEREADVMGARALQARAVAGAPAPAAFSGSSPVVQAFWERKVENDPVTWVKEEYFRAEWYEPWKERKKVSERSKKGKLKTVVRSVNEESSQLGFWKGIVHRPKGRVAAHLATLQGWIDRLGKTKADAIFETYDMASNTDRALIAKHIANFQTLSEGVVTRMMDRQKRSIDTFLDKLTAAELPVYFQGTSQQTEALVDTHAEFNSLVGMVGDEQAFSHAEVLRQDPTAYQGAHYLEEHGAHNSVFQTIKRAVQYARRTGGASTKGNWISNAAAREAQKWAENAADLAVQQALGHGDAAGSLAALPNFAPPGRPPIFGQAGQPTAHIYNSARRVMTDAQAGTPFGHGDVSGSGGRAQAVIGGDFDAEVFGTETVRQNNAYGGTFTGTLGGAALGDNATANGQALRILNVNGSGNLAVTIVATSQVSGQLAGRMIGALTANNARISLRAGVGPNVRYFDGAGNYRGMMSASIAGANSAWTSGLKTVSGSVTDQTLGDGRNDARPMKKAGVQGPKAGYVYGDGSRLTGNGTAYSPGSANEIGGGASKAQNLTVNLTNHVQGNTFQPQSLADIVRNTSFTARMSSYVRVGQRFLDQLIAPAIMVRGTLVDLQASGQLGGVTDLSGLNLQVANLRAGNPSNLSDIATVTAPTAATDYKIDLGGGDWVCFRLAAFTRAPAQTNFRALLKLTGNDRAQYKAFTVYPTP